MVFKHRASVLLVTCALLASCAASVPDTATPELTWEEWSEGLLRDGFGEVIPAIPSSGWEHRDASGWFRLGSQVADYNGDGRVDYVRIQDPPGSYNHCIWVDNDHDGFFDVDRMNSFFDVDREVGGKQRRVPEFELARIEMTDPR